MDRLVARFSTFSSADSTTDGTTDGTSDWGGASLPLVILDLGANALDFGAGGEREDVLAGDRVRIVDATGGRRLGENPGRRPPIREAPGRPIGRVPGLEEVNLGGGDRPSGGSGLLDVGRTCAVLTSVVVDSSAKDPAGDGIFCDASRAT